MSVTESTSSREAALTGRLGYLGTAAKLRLYDGTRPAVSAAATGNLIAEVTLQNPAGTVSAGALTLLASGPATVAITGTPTYARVVNGSDATAFDMSAGVDGSGADCILSDAVLYAGGVVTIISASIV